VKTRQTNPAGRRGLTVIELLLIVVIIVVLVGLFLPRNRISKGPRITCMNNLHQIGLAFGDWGEDHGGKSPMLVSTNHGGTLEWVLSGDVAANFRMLTNDFLEPKYFRCPSDKRKAANSLKELKNQNVSYFVGVDISEAMPAMWLTGDRNLTTNKSDVRTGLITLTTNDSLGWSDKMHNQYGQVGLADGSVQQTHTVTVHSLLHQTGTNANRLAIP